MIGRAARPYWHVDLKWLSGLLLVPTFGATLLVYSLVQLTAEKPATDLMALTAAVMLSPKGLDDRSEIDQMRQVLAATPGGRLQPIPGLRLEIQASDFEGASAREIRLRFFRRLVQPLYDEGLAGLANLADDPELKKKIVDGGGPLGTLTAGTHRTLERIFTMSLAVCVVLFAALIVFSHRFGRLISPGVVAFLVGAPGALLAAALGTPQGSLPEPGQGDLMGLAGYLASQVAPLWGRTMLPIYLTSSLGGLGLIVLAVLGKLIMVLTRGRKPVTISEPAV